MTRKLSVIFLALTLLLAAAYMFRWERGPTQSSAPWTVMYMKDRWTGQYWYTTYNFNVDHLVAGAQVPVDASGKTNEGVAKDKRDNATNAWTFLIIISALATVVSFLWPIRKKMNQTVSI